MQNTVNGFRLSPQQKQLWLWLRHDNTLYSVQCSIRIDGDLRHTILKKAIQTVIEQHPIFSTTFQHLPGHKIPVQVVRSSDLLSWHEVDLRDSDQDEQNRKAADYFQQEKKVPFDLTHGPLLRLSLLIFSSHQHLLIVRLPALCADTWTLQSLPHAISKAYALAETGGTSAQVAMPYAQFSEWQNELLHDEDSDPGKAHWQQQDFSSLHAWKPPFELNIPTSEEFVPEMVSAVLNDETTSGLFALARRQQASPDECLLTCWQILLWRLTGRPDIVVGRVCDGREYDVLHNVMGLVAKALPVPCQLAGYLSFRDVLRQVQAAVRDALEYQEYFTWEHVMGATELAFFPMGFAFEIRPESQVTGGLSFAIEQQYICFDRHKIKLCCVQMTNALTTEFQFDAGRFCVSDIERLAAHFHTLLNSILDTPDAPLDTLTILDADQRHRVLVEFNRRAADVPPDTGIHHIFETQAVRTPDYVAVVCDDQRLSYAALNARANQLAHYLRKLGVGPEVPVALYCDRSLDLMVGLLGILKTGGAYVPLDIGQPVERLILMLAEAQPVVLLTEQHRLASPLMQTLRSRQPTGQGGAHTPQHIEGQPPTVVCLDADWERIGNESTQNVTDTRMTAENLVYIIFTSGSTGRPKGVAVEHRQLCNYLHSILEVLDLPTGSSFATVSTFAADLGHTAVFSALCTGGSLHVMSSASVTDPNRFANYFSRHVIDCLKITPSHLAALQTLEQPEGVLPRQRLVLGGEAASWDMVDQLRTRTPECTLINHYGPTEATVGVSTHRVGKDPLDTGQAYRQTSTVPLGRPLANNQIYLLDAYMQPVPLWTAGELYIGGRNLARGYLKGAALTTERFVPNPFSDEPGARLYRSGDLARYLPDGTIEFLGRVDHQVKLRGFRIELGEIEAILRQHPEVRDAVVLVREDEHHRVRLVGYVCLSQANASEMGKIRNFLQARLPDYMVPDLFVRLDALPLTSNGKVDRRALPAPETARSELATTFVAPRTSTEQDLVEIWTQLLSLEKAGIQDNFFELGGHSLTAIQLVTRIRSAFGVELPVQAIFKSPTIEQLAAQVEDALLTTASADQLDELLNLLEDMGDDGVNTDETVHPS